MAYGRRSSYGKSATGTYRRNRFSTRSIVKAPYRKKTRYVKKEEKKYSDKTLKVVGWAAQKVYLSGTAPSGIVFGVKHTAGTIVGTSAVTNLLWGVGTDAAVSGRIGNKINGKYLQVGLTLQAAVTPVEMGGESANTEVVTDPTMKYMKTNFRIVLVKDMQANNSTNVIAWEEVFGYGGAGVDTNSLASTDFLEIGNMGRFIIMKDMRITLDADDPLKSINFIQKGIGEIRFNSSATSALTNVGYHLLVGQDTIGTAESSARMQPAPVMGNMRLCFTE